MRYELAPRFFNTTGPSGHLSQNSPPEEGWQAQPDGVVLLTDIEVMSFADGEVSLMGVTTGW